MIPVKTANLNTQQNFFSMQNKRGKEANKRKPVNSGRNEDENKIGSLFCQKR